MPQASEAQRSSVALPPELGALLFGRLAAAWRHGLPAAPLLQLLQDDDRLLAKHRHMVAALTERVAATGSLLAGMAALPRLFSPATLALVDSAAPGASGAAMLDALAADYALVARWKQSLASVLRWPLTLAALMVLTLGVVAIWVMPAFAEVFKSFGADLPLLTRVVIGFSNLLGSAGVFAVPAVVLAVWAWRSGRFPARWAVALTNAVERLPLLGRVLRHLRVARLVAWLQHSAGGPAALAAALAHLEATSARSERAALQALRDRLAAGQPLSQALQGLDGHPAALAHTVKVGEDAGNPAAAIALLAEQADADVDDVLQRFEHRLTLALYLTLGSAVGLTVIAMYLPIFRLGAVV